MRYSDANGRWPWPSVDDVKRAATQYAIHQINKVIDHTLRAITDAAKEQYNSLTISPYLKVEGKTTVGGRVVSNGQFLPAAKKGQENDANLRSATHMSATLEFDKDGKHLETFNANNNKAMSKASTGISKAQSVPIGETDVNVSAGYKTEQTMQNGQLVNESREESAGVGVAEGKVGIFYSRETTQDFTNGGSTQVVHRVGVLNIGYSYGFLYVGEFNIGAGIKITRDE